MFARLYFFGMSLQAVFWFRSWSQQQSKPKLDFEVFFGEVWNCELGWILFLRCFRLHVFFVCGDVIDLRKSGPYLWAVGSGVSEKSQSFVNMFH